MPKLRKKRYIISGILVCITVKTLILFQTLGIPWKNWNFWINLIRNKPEKCNNQNYTLPNYVSFKDFDLGFKVLSLVINNSNQTVISAGNSSEISILDLDGKKNYPPFQTKFNGFNALALNEEVGYLVGGTTDGSVVLWQLDKSSKNGLTENYIILSGKQSQSISSSPISSVAISTNGKLIGASSNDTIFIWENTESGKKWELRNTIFSAHSASQIFDLVFGNDDQTLYTVGNDNLIKFWNLDPQGPMNNGDGINLHNNSSLINSLLFIPDNNQLVFGTNNGEVKVGNLQEKIQKVKVEKFIGKHDSQPVNTLAISETGKLLVSGSNDNEIKLWNLCTKKSFQTLSKHNGWVRSVDISSNKTYIVSGSLDQKIIIWKIDNE